MWGGALKAELQRSREEGTWELCHSNILAKSTFCSKVQTAALMLQIEGIACY